MVSASGSFECSETDVFVKKLIYFSVSLFKVFEYFFEVLRIDFLCYEFIYNLASRTEFKNVVVFDFVSFRSITVAYLDNFKNNSNYFYYLIILLAFFFVIVEEIIKGFIVFGFLRLILLLLSQFWLKNLILFILFFFFFFQFMQNFKNLKKYFNALI